MADAIVLPDVPMQLAARNPQQMEASRNFLLRWFEKRIVEETANGDELTLAYESALKHKWAVTALRRQVDKSALRVRFYQKAKTAIEAGFTLVPNFPIDLFAIRVDQSRPTHQQESTTANWFPSIRDEAPKQLAQGEGEYVSPIPTQETGSYERNRKDKPGEKETVRWARAVEFAEVDFPVTVAHPIVMDATAQAMGLKLFDSLGICQDIQASRRMGRRKGDPLVIGRIYMPRPSRYGNPKCMSFLVAWHVDLRGL